MNQFTLTRCAQAMKKPAFADRVGRGYFVIDVFYSSYLTDVACAVCDPYKGKTTLAK